jgi:hypothetical protein
MAHERTVIGLTEKVTVEGENGEKKTLVARVDTGATKSSIDEKLAKELRLGPVMKNKVFRSAHGHKVRPIINVTIILKKKRITCWFSVIDREHMNYKMLIGQNALKKGGFLIDPIK